MKRVFLLIAICWQCAFLAAQNVGIGTTSPTSPLEVKSGINSELLKLNGPQGMFISLNEAGLYRGYFGSYAGNAEDVDFGTGASNNTGKLHLTIKASPKLTIDNVGNVGIGTTTPQWRLDVNGSMQLLGRLFVSGSSGTQGQVLTSNGLSAPSWQTLSAGGNNNVRFAVSFTTAFVPSDYCPLLAPARYNLSPFDVSISTTGITINRAGLYHFDVFVRSGVSFDSPPTYAPLFGLSLSTGAPVKYPVADLVRMEPHQYSGTSNSFLYSGKHTLDVYISAGSVVRPYQTFDFGAGIYPNVSGYIAGYLISE